MLSKYAAHDYSGVLFLFLSKYISSRMFIVSSEYNRHAEIVLLSDLFCAIIYVQIKCTRLQKDNIKNLSQFL